MKRLPLAVVGIALLAVLLVLAQPVCQAYELGHEPHGAETTSHEADLCCADHPIESVALSAPAKAKETAEGAAAVSHIAFALPQASAAYRLPAARPPAPALSYHARTARDLR